MVVPFFISELCKLFKEKRFIKIMDDGQRTTLLISRKGDIRGAHTHLPSVNYSKDSKPLTISDLGLAMSLTEISTEVLQSFRINAQRCHDSRCEAEYIWYDANKAWKVCRHGVIR